MAADAPQPVNPYQPAAEVANLAAVLFVGRQKAFERLYQQLTDPIKAETTVVLGRQASGKTALLQHFDAFFDESFVTIYVPLRQAPLTSEAAWLRDLARRITAEIAAHSFTHSRLPGDMPERANVRMWFEEDYLKEVINVIRRHRRLVLLLDDAEALLDAVAADRLPSDTFDFLHHLLKIYRQLGMVLTLDTRYEAEVLRLAPLAALTSVFRLTRLTEDDSAQLLRLPVEGIYTVTDSAAAAVYRAAGGQPLLLQRFGYHLFGYQTRTGQTEITVETVKPITPAVYGASADEFRRVWQELNQNERLVLTAITSLIYDDPLTPVNAEMIAAWLVGSDFLLDVTAVNAALRSLEYREIITTPVQITAGLFQTWLLENARLVAPTPVETTAAPAIKPQRRLPNRLGVALAAVVVIAVIVLIVSLATTPQESEAPLPPPTVTLVVTP